MNGIHVTTFFFFLLVPYGKGTLHEGAHKVSLYVPQKVIDPVIDSCFLVALNFLHT